MSKIILNKIKHKKYSSFIECVHSNMFQDVKKICKQSKRRSLTETDSQGRTALHIAAKDGYCGMVEMLLKFGADANYRDNNGRTPLHDACSSNNNKSFIDIIRLLILNGKSHCSVLSNDGISPLYYFIQKISYVDDINVFINTISLMTKKGADINSQTKQGESILHLACASGKIGIIDYLIKNGADINSQTKYSETPLHYAVRCEKLLVAQLLLDSNANPLIVSKFGSIIDYCKQTNNEEFNNLITNASYVYQARIMNKRKNLISSPCLNQGEKKEELQEKSLNIDNNIIEKLKKLGYELPSIMAAMYTLSNINMPYNNEQMIINEIENGNDSRNNECSCCMDNIVNCVLVPCGHASLCLQCAKQTCAENCIICDSKVDSIHQLYFQ